MEVIKNLLARFRHTASLFLIGFILIIYIALGFLYLQQDSKQAEFRDKITKLSLILARPLPSVEELRAEYDNVTLSLAPKSDKEYIEGLVSIAEESGIDTDKASDKFSVPPVKFSQVKVGGGTYQLLSFRGIKVQGDYDNVTAFLSDLDSGKTLGTMVLKGVVTSEVEGKATGEDGDRRAEFRSVESAVMKMMNDNALLEIPNPMNFAGGVATNLMGDDSNTGGTVEGFPDITTTVAEKGYTGADSPRDGYVLYGHDKISTDNTTQFKTISYNTMLTTRYYYTCEADGTVRQFDGANVVTAREYLGSGEFKPETRAIVDVDIYTKP